MARVTCASLKAMLDELVDQQATMVTEHQEAMAQAASAAAEQMQTAERALTAAFLASKQAIKQELMAAFEGKLADAATAATAARIRQAAEFDLKLASAQSGAPAGEAAAGDRTTVYFDVVNESVLTSLVKTARDCKIAVKLIDFKPLALGDMGKPSLNLGGGGSEGAKLVTGSKRQFDSLKEVKKTLQIFAEVMRTGVPPAVSNGVRRAVAELLAALETYEHAVGLVLCAFTEMMTEAYAKHPDEVGGFTDGPGLQEDGLPIKVWFIMMNAIAAKLEIVAPAVVDTMTASFAASQSGGRGGKATAAQEVCRHFNMEEGCKASGACRYSHLAALHA